MPGSPPKRRLNHERLTFAIVWLVVATGRAGAARTNPLVALPKRVSRGSYLHQQAGRKTMTSSRRPQTPWPSGCFTS